MVYITKSKKSYFEETSAHAVQYNTQAALAVQIALALAAQYT